VGAVGLLTLVLLLGLVAPFLVDGQTVRNQLVAKLSAWAEGDLKVHGDVRLTSLFELTIEAENVEIREPERFPDVQRVRAGLIEARLSIWDLLNGRIVFGKVWVEHPIVTLHETASDIRPQELWRAVLLSNPPLMERFIDAAKVAPFMEIEFNEGLVHSASSDKPVTEGFEGFSLRIERQSESAHIYTKGQVIWQGTPVNLVLERAPFRPEGPTRQAALRVEVANPALGSLAANGRIIRANGERFAGTVAIRNARAGTLAQWLDVPIGEAFTDMRYRATGALEVTADKISLQQLEMQAGETRMTGLLSLVMAGEKPTLSGTLGLSEIDLRNLTLDAPVNGVLIAEDPLRVRRGGASEQGQRIGAWLQTFDADLRLSAEKLAFDGISTGETAAFLSVGDGVATLDVAELMIFDGMLNGQFSARWQDGLFRLTGKGKASNVELSALLSSFGTHGVATGPTDISFAADGTGPTIGAALRGARYSGDAMALQGGVLALNIAAFAAKAHQHQSYGGEPQAQINLAPGRGAYEAFRTSFNLHRGKLDLQMLEITQGEWIIRGRGRADLANLLIDCQFNVSRGAGALSAADRYAGASGRSEALEETIRLQISGPLHQPRVMYKSPAPPLTGLRGKRAGWP